MSLEESEGRTDKENGERNELRVDRDFEREREGERERERERERGRGRERDVVEEGREKRDKED